jgi:four helix bundle protein
MGKDASDRFRNLRVWKDAVELAQLIYAATRSFPEEERFGLCAQMRRAAVSVPSNIAEGSVRRSTRDFARFLDISLGSLAELETQIEIARDLQILVDSDKISANLIRVRRMLYSLRGALERKY